MMETLFENEACLVINKLCGEDCEKLQGIPQNCKLVHRLDTPASGCLLLAKTAEAAAFLSAAFSRSNGAVIEKRYWAIVEKPENPLPLPESFYSGVWQSAVNWIYFMRNSNKSVICTEKKQGAKEAVLRYRYTGSGDRYLFLEIDLGTGRHHQIRAQLAALRLHIKGDLKYGARRSEKNGGIRLHARSLRFPNPLNKEQSVLCEALPSPDPLWQAYINTYIDS
ncbi:MAG: RNA pseudouridine synthase [Treponema sp.]|nr:RNA pseudouridine synthase [Treponema sp.]